MAGNGFLTPTYIPTGERWLYLALTVDLGTRRARDRGSDVTKTEKLVFDSLTMAILL
jgi:hypothetical protein